jgi:hypothetical protein
MSDHKMGEKVLKEVSIKNASGKQESVIDVARNIWGDGPASANTDATKRQFKDVAADGQEVRDRHGHAHDPHADRVAEASHKIKLFNNELHKPGGPLADSSLELIGFDKSGRLLLIQRDQQGKVEGKFLVDSDSGKIVGRTLPGPAEKWEHGPGYDRTAQPLTAQGVFDRETGATVIKNKAGNVQVLVDCHGDKRVYERDAKENVNEIFITRGIQTEHFKLGSAVAGVSNHLWYKEPYKANDRTPGFQFEVKSDGSLVQHVTKTKSITFGANGSILEKQGSLKDVLTRKGYVNEVDQADKRLLAVSPPQELT